jgi:hypothetical protein
MTDANPTPHFLFRRKDHGTDEVLDPGLAFVPDVTLALADLEQMARREDWGENRSVLRNYLNYTVHQLVREGKIVEAVDNHGRPVAAFNTGLLNDDVRPIFGFLTRNNNVLSDAQPWYFTRWTVASDVPMRHFAKAPERARYWKISPGELLFNPDWPVEERLEHIIGDNVDRFPRLLQELPHLRKHALRGAIDDVKEQIQADPHLAVPGYHFETDSISLLLPLRLVHARQVDLALVVGPFGEDRYAAWTVMPLDWAYRNARLIKAPSADWLNAFPHPDDDQASVSTLGVEAL